LPTLIPSLAILLLLAALLEHLEVPVPDELVAR
jgi:hypothetical protein